jgi:hypothetical protein
MNKEKMQRLITRLERAAATKHFSMNVFFRPQSLDSDPIMYPDLEQWSCRTTACVAGHCVAESLDKPTMAPRDWLTSATDWLELEYPDTGRFMDFAILSKSWWDYGERWNTLCDKTQEEIALGACRAALSLGRFPTNLTEVKREYIP